MRPQEKPDAIHAVGIVTLPPGMSPEEAERLVREADQREKEKN